MTEFFDLEGYGVYVWPAYGAMAVILIGLTLAVIWRNAKVRAELADLERRLAGDQEPRR